MLDKGSVSSLFSARSISYFLKGKVKESDMYLRKNAFYKANNIKIVVTDAKVNYINPECIKPSKPARKSYPYDKLCIATGSKPFVPPMENVDGKDNAVTFLDLASAKAVKKLAN